MNIKADYFWFRIFKTPGIGPKTLIAVAEILEGTRPDADMFAQSLSDLFAQFPELAKILERRIREEDKERIYAAYRNLKERGIAIIHPGHPCLPAQLRDTAPVLFVKGRKEHLLADSVAIVGARDVSSTGLQIAKKLADELAYQGINIVSGYARGVDSAAHIGALEAGGTTTLVLAEGIKRLRKKTEFRSFNWAQKVLVVSQFDPDVLWLARNAMQRNRLVCRLSKAIIVIESGPERNELGKGSGTFQTAKTALKMDVPLFVLDPRCLETPPQGNADLIALGGTSLAPETGAAAITERIDAPRTPKESTDQLLITF